MDYIINLNFKWIIANFRMEQLIFYFWHKQIKSG